MKTQIAVIGAGPAGYPAAFRAADLGMQVTLVDPAENPGGVCLYRGCIPSKALLHIAKVITEAKEAEEQGVTFGDPKLDIDKIREWKDGVVKQLTGGLTQLRKPRGVEHIQGTAHFKDNRTLTIEKTDGGTEELTFEHAIIASGSRPAMIPGLDIEASKLWDSTSALELTHIPKKLLVVGGGYIGLELGSVYAALGSEVTVVEMMPNLLPGADPDLVRFLSKRLNDKFEAILLKTKVAAMKDAKDGVEVTFEAEDKDADTQVFDQVLVSVGRKPNSGELSLENTKIEIDEKGFIKVDPQRRTAEPNIFAVGDVAGEPMLAHKGTHEGILAAEVINGSKNVFAPQAIPAVVFTDPEIAWVGLTETQAKAEKLNVAIGRFPWATSGRALTMARTDGVTKLVVDKESGRVLGVAMAGQGAGEMISEGALAIEMGATAEDLALTIHPHPTLSETVMEAAEVFLGHSTHVYRKK